MSETAANVVTLGLIWLLFIAALWLDRRANKRERL